MYRLSHVQHKRTNWLFYLLQRACAHTFDFVWMLLVVFLFYYGHETHSNTQFTAQMFVDAEDAEFFFEEKITFFVSNTLALNQWFPYLTFFLLCLFTVFTPYCLCLVRFIVQSINFLNKTLKFSAASVEKPSPTRTITVLFAPVEYFNGSRNLTSNRDFGNLV